MLNRKINRKITSKNKISLKYFLNNYPMILLLVLFVFMMYSIIDYHYFYTTPSQNVREYNSKKN